MNIMVVLFLVHIPPFAAPFAALFRPQTSDVLWSTLHSPAGAQLGPPLGLLPAELLSQHLLGRLSAGAKARATRLTKAMTSSWRWPGSW